MYYVFMFDSYYPGGGMNDFMGVFNTFEEAREFVETSESYDNYQIVSGTTIMQEG